MRKLKIVLPSVPFDYDFYQELSKKYKNSELGDSFQKSISITPGQPDELKIWLKTIAYKKGVYFLLETYIGSQRLSFNVGEFSYSGKDTDRYLPLGDIDTFQEIYETEVIDRLLERLYSIVGMKKDKYGFEFITKNDLKMLVKYGKG